MRPLDRFNAIRDLRAPGLRAFEKVVLFILAARLNVERGYAWPSLRRLGADAGMGETAVRRVLRALQAMGLIRVEAQRGSPNRYWIIDDAISGGPRDADPSSETRPVVRVARGWGSRREPEGEQEVDHEDDHRARARAQVGAKAETQAAERVERHFASRFVATKACSPSSATARRRRKAAADLVAHHGEDEAMRMIDRAFGDSWFVANQSDLGFIARNPDRYRGPAPLVSSQAADSAFLEDLERRVTS